MTFCDFGKTIKKRLIDMGKNQEWLIDQVKKKTGLYFDSSYMYKIMTGQCEPLKISSAIREILEI